MSRRLLLLGLVFTAPVFGGTEALDAVLGALAGRRHGEAAFTEKQFLSILKHPLESSGVLIFDAPQHLEKRTLEPRPESLVLDGNRATVQRGARRREFDLQSYPQLIPLIESLRATLAGDRAALERQFHLDFSGNLSHWTLKLSPLDARLTRTVAEVQIEGDHDNLIEVRMLQPDGDRTLLKLQPSAVR